LLKNHTNFSPNEINICVFVIDIIAIDYDSPRSYRFQAVDTTEEGALAGTTWADYDNDFSPFYVKVNTPQNFQ
jgi:hypothetical protein